MLFVRRGSTERRLKMINIREVLDIASLVGIPTLFACVVYFMKVTYKFGKRIEILINAQQKQMRRDLTNDYHKFMSEGKISDEDLDTWESAYQAYHALNINGVMDARRAELIKLNAKGNI